MKENTAPLNWNDLLFTSTLHIPLYMKNSFTERIFSLQIENSFISKILHLVYVWGGAEWCA